MARITLTLNSNLFDEDQNVSIRENLPARTLISEIRKEYTLDDGNYVLRLQGSNKLVDPDKTLEQSGVQTGAVLIFAEERRAPARAALVMDNTGNSSRRPLTGSVRATITEEGSGKVFEILWQPAVIGRPDAKDPTSMEKLAVNLESFEAAKTVSRSHARILEYSGQYYLEAIAENNPTSLNNDVVRIGERRLLQAGDKIGVGKFVLAFNTK